MTRLDGVNLEIEIRQCNELDTLFLSSTMTIFFNRQI